MTKRNMTRANITRAIVSGKIPYPPDEPSDLYKELDAMATRLIQLRGDVTDPDVNQTLKQAWEHIGKGLWLLNPAGDDRLARNSS
jgi:hypothetical protein